ncbi:hypothetical protein BH23ACT8_BH23ACT8_21560 [soil metagenome]
MSEMISVRLDEDAKRALAQLEAAGMTRSDAVRAGLVAAAERDRRLLAAEADALAEDPEDRAEAAALAEMMEDLRAPW